MFKTLLRCALRLYVIIPGIVASIDYNLTDADRNVALGINLGMTTITASYLNGDLTPVPLLNFEGNDTYQNFLADTLNNHEAYLSFRGNNHGPYLDYEYVMNDCQIIVPASFEVYKSSFARELFTEIFINITTAAKDAIGAPAGIRSIAYPQHFDYKLINSVSKAAKHVDPEFEEDYGLHDLWRMVAAGYFHGGCTGCLREDWSEDPPTHALLLVNVEADDIELSIGDVSPWGEGSSIRESFRLINRSKQTSNFQNAAEKVLFKKALQSMTHDHFNTGRYYASDADFLSVILTGRMDDSSAADFQIMVDEALPEHSHGVQLVDRELRGAFGASCIWHSFVTAWQAYGYPLRDCESFPDCCRFPEDRCEDVDSRLNLIALRRTECVEAEC